MRIVNLISKGNSMASVVIVGAGPGLSGALARLCARNGMAVALVARNINKLKTIAAETDASLHQCDASDANQVAGLFTDLDNTIGTADMVVYNPSARGCRDQYKTWTRTAPNKRSIPPVTAHFWWRNRLPNGCGNRATAAYCLPVHPRG